MKTVLLAYEREQDLAAIETLLQARGHRALKTRSGVEALEVARREAPYIIVSDVLLPKLDGFALCRRVKEDPVLRHLPVLLLSFRVEGPKYEAFAAEVGAERFFPRGSSLEELVSAIEEQSPGSGTMRIPALVPEMLERQQQDRRRVAELERHLKETESARQQLEIAERVAREHAEREARERIDAAADAAARMRELQDRIQDLEARQQQLAQAETQARGAAAESRAEVARIGVLEARLADLQSSQARAVAAAVDAERAFTAQPVPTWVSDMESHEIRSVSDSAAALFGIEPARLVGRSIVELLPGYEPGNEPARPVAIDLVRNDGSPAVLELQRHSVSFGGRACWLTAARDVTRERAALAAGEQAAFQALALEQSPIATCLVGGDGRLRYANTAFLQLLGLEPGQVETSSLQQFEADREADATIRSIAIGSGGQVVRDGRWRRTDGSVFEVETLSVAAEGLDGFRVVTARDVSHRNRAAQHAAREQRCTAGVLDLAQNAHSLTEPEILSHALALVGDLSGAPTTCAFLPLPDAGQLELAAVRSLQAGGQDLSVLARWRGMPPAGSALFDCFSTQRIVTRETAEDTGALVQAGLPGSFRRQICVPLLDGGRLAGVLLLADKPQAFEEDDARRAALVADGLWRVLRRRRSDAEVVSAMDHMERVMLGVIESLAVLAESQDACKTGRARRIADLAAGIGTALGLPGHSVRGLRVMGQLIDVGMLQIPREILWRPGTLSAAEFELVKSHVERGYESIRPIEFPWPVAEVVRQHHERLDGSGYPRGLKGEEILLEARILAVADAAEAMLAPRPQRAPLPLPACIEELQSQAGRRYDARVVKACVKLLREREQRAAGEQAVGQRIA